MAKEKVKKAVVAEVKAGRPATFNSVDDLKIKIDGYFEFIKGEFKMVDQIVDGEVIKVKEWIRYPEAPAISSLAYFLGFESRQSVYDYEKSGEYSYTIKRARLMVEMAYEQALLSRNSTGAIFALKNFGWSDKQEIEHSGEMGIVWKEEKTYEANPQTDQGD